MIKIVISLVFSFVVCATSNLVFKKIDVQVGPVGSDEDVRIKICDQRECCTTKVLSNLLSSEWKANKLETWDGSKLGNCSTKVFDDKLSTIEVAITKGVNKNDALEVKSLVLSGQVGSDKKKIQKFQCGHYKFTSKDSKKVNFCSNENVRTPTPKRPISVIGKPTVPKVSGAGARNPKSASIPNLLITKINVQVGPDGTKDDVSMKICDSQKCCSTSKLSHKLSSEWVKNKLETWEGSKLGNCSTILLKSGGLDVSVIKTIKKKDPLDITSISIEMASASDKKKVTVQKLTCGSYKFGPTDKTKINFCLNEKLAGTSSSKYKVNNIVVQMGNDGTDDDVSLEICTAKSVLKCCSTGKLDSFGDDWSKNSKETWKNKDLGDCKKKTWDACEGFDVTVKKHNGKDSLKISNITLGIEDPNNANDAKRFVCLNYNIGATDTIKRTTCTLERSSSLSCPKTPVTGRRPSSSPSTGRRPSTGRLSNLNQSKSSTPRPFRSSNGK